MAVITVMTSNINMVKGEDVAKNIEIAKPAVEENISATDSSTFTYENTSARGYVSITGYSGRDATVEIPALLDGNVVVGLSNDAFNNNQSLVQVNLPATMQKVCNKAFYGCTNLDVITINGGNNNFLQVKEDVLFTGTELVLYPPSREGDTYVIPNGTTTYWPYAFNSCKNLTKVIVPQTITLGALAAFLYSTQICNIVYKHDVIDSDVISSDFYQMFAGSTITVKSSALQTTVDALLDQYGSGNMTTTVGITPADTLTLNNGSNKMSVTWNPNTIYNLYDLYTQTPKDTTDNVTWSVDNDTTKNDTYPEGITYIYQADQKIKLNNGSGDFDLIGTDESGHTITIHVKVYIPLQNFTTNESVDLDLESNNIKYVNNLYTPSNAYVTSENGVSAITYASSKPSVVTVDSDGKITAVGIGQSTITVKADNSVTKTGIDMIKTFVATVDSDYYLPNHCHFDYYYKDQSYYSSSNYSEIYNGTTIKPEALVTDKDETTLYEGTDYTITYTNNISPGTATVMITGTGDYYGTITKTFTITAAPISNCTASIPNQTYKGSQIKPADFTVKNRATTLVSGTDYTITSYGENIKAGTGTITITGKGTYSGTKTVRFTIVTLSIEKATMSTISNQIYTGKAIKPTPKVKYNGKTLKNGTDYSLSYSKNTKVGTATIKIKGKGNYTGTTYKKFTINKPSQKIKATTSYSKKYGDKSFHLGAKLKTGNGKITYKSSNKKILTVSSKGKVTIKGTGQATITIAVASTSKYNKATKKITITIAPKKEKVTYLKSKSKKKLTVKWNKDKTADGYQIQYSTSSKFKHSTKVTVKKYKTTSQTIKSLKSGKKYYVRVRAYKTVNGKKVYGSWSTAKKVTIKKK